MGFGDDREDRRRLVAMQDEDIPPDIVGRRAEDGMVELRREYDQLLDEMGVQQELIRSLRRQNARYLEAIERQGIQIAKIDEYVRGRDMIRGRDIEAILDSAR